MKNITRCLLLALFSLTLATFGLESDLSFAAEHYSPDIVAGLTKSIHHESEKGGSTALIEYESVSLVNPTYVASFIGSASFTGGSGTARTSATPLPTGAATPFNLAMSQNILQLVFKCVLVVVSALFIALYA
jgi:hypothetical protein